MKTETRKLVEVLYLDNYNKIYNTLTEFLKAKDEDALVIIFREAIYGGHLRVCSKTAAIISGFISEYDVIHSRLSVIGHGINDPANFSAGCEWLDVILSENAEIDLDEWVRNWDQLDYVIEVRRMFEEARYTTAIDDRCRPIPSTSTPEHFRSDSDPSDLLSEEAYYNEYGFLVFPEDKSNVSEIDSN